jgi:hypothetical protein
VASREPFSRHRASGGNDDRPLGERIIGAYEFAAAEYGWPPATIEEALSDEQLVAYLDAATDRLTRRRQDDFDVQIAAVRTGTVFAYNERAFGNWQRARDARDGRKVGLTGAALEGAISHLARANPEYVVHGP